jgi:hypothetical protein
LGFVIAGNDYKGFSYISKGETKVFGKTVVAFDAYNEEADLFFTLINDSIYLGGKNGIKESVMGGTELNVSSNSILPVNLKKLYNTGNYNVVVQEIIPEAVIAAFPNENMNSRAGRPAYIFTIKNEMSRSLLARP